MQIRTKYLATASLTAALSLYLPAPVQGATSATWEVSSGGNGHIYEVVIRPSGISWTEARDEAIAAGGHLATITTVAENQFVHALAASEPNAWIDVGDTRGPWLGGFQPNNLSEPSGGWTWVTGEPFIYTNWGISASPDGQQPKDNPPGEDYLHFFGTGPNNLQDTWNDLLVNGNEPGGAGAPRAYIIEFIPEPSSTMLIAAGSFVLIRRRKN